MRHENVISDEVAALEFPFLFGGTFIEADKFLKFVKNYLSISLPFRRDFH